MAQLDGIDTLILAGGLGSRLRGVIGDSPKILAPVGGRPFLDILLHQLARFGAARAVLSLGFRADLVLAHLRARGAPLPVTTVVEPEQLGTAGAVRYATSVLSSDPVLVLNGDTWITADFSAFIGEHRRSGKALSLLAARVEEASRFGTLRLAGDGALLAFKEKGAHGPGLVSTGACLLSQAALAQLRNSTGPSLEIDFIATLPPERIHVHARPDTMFIDIGTPESFAEASSRIKTF